MTGMHKSESWSASFDQLMGGSSKASLMDPSSLRQISSKKFVRILIYVAGSILFIIGFCWLLKPNSVEEISSKVEKYSQLEPGGESMVKAESEALQLYATRHLNEHLAYHDFREFAQRLRFFSDLLITYEQSHPEHVEMYKEARFEKSQALSTVIELTRKKKRVPDDLLVKAYQPIAPYPASAFLWEMEQEMFPWAHHKFSSLLEMKKSYKGKGMIIPTGSHHLRFAIHLIRHVRLLNFEYPIIVAYAGTNDLQKEELDYLTRLKVGTMDIATIFNITQLDLAGWQIKPYAMLAAPFEEVIMADADIVFLQNPAMLFDDPGYLEHGVVIFHDRTLFEGDKGKTEWLDHYLPHPISERVKNTRMYRQLSAHEQESGVVLWNKQTRFQGALASCKMNSKNERDNVTYKQFYGDKESFWIGLEMAGQSWSELQPVPGVIGDSRSDFQGKLVACGRILQFDRLGWPFWFNGAIVTNKREESQSRTIMNFTHFAREGKWDFGTSCLNKDVTPINATLKEIINDISALYVSKIDYSSLTEFETNP